VPEGVTGYPRWQGPLSQGPAFPVIVKEEVRKAVRNMWGQLAVGLAFAYAVIYLGSLNTLGQARGESAAHTMDNFLFFLNNLRWASLGIAAIMAGPALLEDHRRGALELYLSRGITRRDYLTGKVVAVFGMSALVMVGPALLYVLGSFLLFKAAPAQFGTAPLGAIVQGLLWAAMVSGLGLGLSGVAKTSRGATLILFGGFAVADVFVSKLLESITRNGVMQILSPFSALAQQNTWLFGTAAPFGFPEWWGLVEWALLTLVGWGLVAWKYPRLAGE
jgi:ABC-type transport system involved in multi-copper enzyme maturation permease subunit